MLNLDKNMVAHFEEQGVKKVKVFFYEAGCSGTKVEVATDFEIEENLTLALSLEERGQYGFDVYIEEKDREKLENARITRVVVADHTGEEKIRYVFSSEQVLDRCGCGTSFGFEKPVPKIDLEKLRKLRERFGK
jgi:Fe-S cluster assembly iron-binding protein IscA